MDPITLQLGVTALKGILSLIGGKTGQGDLPATHCYVRSYRMTRKGPDNDGNIIIEKATGFPVSRWSYKQQKFIDLTGMTKYGVPVFTNDPYYWDKDDQIWTRYDTHTIDTYTLIGGHKIYTPFPNDIGGERRLWDDLDWFGPLHDPVEMNPYRGPTVEQQETKDQLNSIAVGAGAGGALVAAGFTALSISPWWIVAGVVVGGCLGDRIGKHVRAAESLEGLRQSPGTGGSTGRRSSGPPEQPQGGGRAS